MRYNPAKHHLPVCPAFGLLPVNKPAEWTSFDVVNFIRSRFNVPKVGHCGTLDPAATGLLLIVLGKFTSLSNQLSGVDKGYRGTMKLGVETDSGDLDGTVVRERPVTCTEADVRRVLAGFLGKSRQLPPMYSAVKVDGKKLYELAREGKTVEREPREIEITALEVTECRLPEVSFTLECSKGTYVRTLCTDAGEKLGCGAVLTSLCRTRCGRYTLEEAVTVEQLKAMTQEEFTDLMARRVVAELQRGEKR